MSKNFSIELTGYHELVTTISNAHPKAVTQAIQVTKNNTEKLKKDAQRRAPYDTGFLHDNIVTQYAGMNGEVNSKAAYSAYLEYGTRYMNAQPYMFPALEAIRESYERDLTDVMRGVFR